jgi:hypothetical protein
MIYDDNDDKKENKTNRNGAMVIVGPANQGGCIILRIGNLAD